MLVSVIIPAYNREKTIRRAVDSVLAQTYRSIEIIVVDDGSSDNTADILGTYGEKLRLICQKNSGASAARNTGIRAAQGEIIAFLDSDDAWLPDKIARQVALLDRPELAHISCCISNTELIYSDGTRKNSFTTAQLRPATPEGIWTNPVDVLLTRFLLFNQAVAVRRSALERVGFFNEKLRILEDYDLALRLATLGPWTYIADPLVIWYGGTENSLSLSAPKKEAVQIALKVLTDLSSATAGGGLSSHPLIKRNIPRLTRVVHALTQLEQKGSFPRLMGWINLRVGHYREAAFRRMPSYPKMKTEPTHSRVKDHDVT